MRVALAAVLFAEPDLLLLDEPTNYLDLEGTLWLTDHLARYPRSVIVISHDRDLLDDAVDWILHLEGGKLTLYRGGYTAFARQRAEKLVARRQARQEAGGRAQAPAGLRRPLQGQGHARRARRSRASSGSPSSSRSSRSPTTRCGRSVFPTPAKALSPPIIALDKVSVGYEPGRPVLRRLSLRIDTDDRIALLGPNGNGKSTLAKLLAGRLAAVRRHGHAARPHRGRVFRAASARRADPAATASTITCAG